MQALRDYESRVTKYTEQLVSGIRQRAGQVINASDWFLYYGFDVMGDLAFGQPFEMLVNGKEHHVIKMLHSGMLPLGMLSPVVWIIPVLAALPRLIQPGLAKRFLQFISWCAEQVDKRRQTQPEVPDITSWLLTDLEIADNPAEALRWLHGDARLIVVAGSDTVAVTLTHAFYHLAANPSHLQKVRSEIKQLWPAGEPFNVRQFQNAEYMNGVINEALRMHPAVPSGVQRLTPPEGITIDGVWVPGGVNVAVPNYAIGRCQSFPPYTMPQKVHPIALSQSSPLNAWQCPITNLKQHQNTTLTPTPSSPSVGPRNPTLSNPVMPSHPFLLVRFDSPLNPHFLWSRP